MFCARNLVKIKKLLVLEALLSFLIKKRVICANCLRSSPNTQGTGPFLRLFNKRLRHHLYCIFPSWKFLSPITLYTENIQCSDHLMPKIKYMFLVVVTSIYGDENDIFVSFSKITNSLQYSRTLEFSRTRKNLSRPFNFRAPLVRELTPSNFRAGQVREN